MLEIRQETAVIRHALGEATAIEIAVPFSVARSATCPEDCPVKDAWEYFVDRIMESALLFLRKVDQVLGSNYSIICDIHWGDDLGDSLKKAIEFICDELAEIGIMTKVDYSSEWLS